MLAIPGLLVVLAAHPAGAPAEMAVRDFDVRCATSGGQLCEPPFSVVVATTAQKTLLRVKYDVHPAHCSSMRLHIFVDGTLVRTTGFLGWTGAPPPYDRLPLGTGILSLRSVNAGTHFISVRAEGQPSGCNARGLSRWRGSLQVLP